MRIASCFVVIVVIGIVFLQENTTTAQRQRNVIESRFKDVKAINLNITAGRRDMLELSHNLITIAKDKNRTNGARRDAILSMARSLDYELISFLVNNIDLKIVPKFAARINDDDDLKDTPCYYVLRLTEDWRVSQVIMDKVLDTPQSEKRIGLLSRVLSRNLKTYHALVIVENEMKDWAHPGLRNPARAKARHSNLKKMYAILYQMQHRRKPRGGRRSGRLNRR